MEKKPERRSLGRGLSALMADVSVESDPQTPDRPRRADLLIPVEKLVPNPNQPRRDFQPEALQELAASIRAKGVIQPLIVRAPYRPPWPTTQSPVTWFNPAISSRCKRLMAVC